MTWIINPDRVLCKRDPMLYGQFLEHFHRQVYGGVFMPGHPLADENGFRRDVIEALRKIRTPIIRWPGGCFVSSYHWEKGVGPRRVKVFDKSWRVEDDNTFGTDEFIKLCRAIGCEPYICLNAGTGSEEEMSNWLEYCNLEYEGEYASKRIENGYPEPYKVKYWSIGNENYGHWELGAKDAKSWARLVLETSKLMKRVDPETELSAAALTDIDWNVNLLNAASERLHWISIHSYWDFMPPSHTPATYEQCMAFTDDLERSVRQVRGLLNAYGLEKKIRIAYDEWNLRGWFHPNIHTVAQGLTKEDYLTPRDKNDINSTYTMADAVFSACFLNMLLRNADIVGMANFAPMVNTRGCIFTHDKGIVLRSTYHVFDLFVNLMGDEVVDLFGGSAPVYAVENKEGRKVEVEQVDILATKHSQTGALGVSLINKHAQAEAEVKLQLPEKYAEIHLTTLAGRNADDYNDIDRNHVIPFANDEAVSRTEDGSILLRLPAHSVNVLTIG
ncbi:MAG: alpha-N-arabinofuranosidase [Clostridia bacterium]|nr:alpha-N-arabinofuranosidase [Clostridia bacterium]